MGSPGSERRLSLLSQAPPQPSRFPTMPALGRAPAALRLLRRGRNISSRTPAGACVAVARPTGVPAKNARAASQPGMLGARGALGTTLPAGMLEARRATFVTSAVAEPTSSKPAAPAIDYSAVDLPTSDQSESLLKIRHTVRSLQTSSTALAACFGSHEMLLDRPACFAHVCDARRVLVPLREPAHIALSALEAAP